MSQARRHCRRDTHNDLPHSRLPSLSCNPWASMIRFPMQFSSRRYAGHCRTACLGHQAGSADRAWSRRSTSRTRRRSSDLPLSGAHYAISPSGPPAGPHPSVRAPLHQESFRQIIGRLATLEAVDGEGYGQVEQLSRAYRGNRLNVNRTEI